MANFWTRGDEKVGLAATAGIDLASQQGAFVRGGDDTDRIVRPSTASAAATSSSAASSASAASATSAASAASASASAASSASAFSSSAASSASSSWSSWLALGPLQWARQQGKQLAQQLLGETAREDADMAPWMVRSDQQLLRRYLANCSLYLEFGRYSF